jgi:hypothetical protein
MAQIDHVVDARAEEIVGGGAGKHHGRTPRKQPLLEIKLGETAIGRHPRKPVFMRVPGIVQGRLLGLRDRSQWQQLQCDGSEQDGRGFLHEMVGY